jgi:hypothetical protein
MSMRKRQKIQKMSRCLGLAGCAEKLQTACWRARLRSEPRLRGSGPAETFFRSLVCLLLAAGLNAAILPDQFADFRKGAETPVEVTEQRVWDEYGLESVEGARYKSGGRSVAITAWKLKDTTGAVGAAQWLQPGVVQHGNYVLRVNGRLSKADLAELQSKLPDPDSSSSPSLPARLPADNLVRNSQRYLLGPESLALFEPRVPADLAGFHMGAEGQLANYRVQGREARLLLLSYPTPQIAGERFRDFEKQPELKARRHGPLVAVVLDGTPEMTEKLLNAVTYKPRVTWSEYIPEFENPGPMLVGMTELAGYVILFALFAGLLFGGVLRLLASRWGIEYIDERLTSLDINR